MCDTMVAPPPSTTERIMLFGKNSDRQRNEAQGVEYVARAEHASEQRLKAQYIVIPQAPRTHAFLLCRPFWIWGGEMGANEHGVAIGNEAVHARSPAQEEPALTGQDLIRLGLERASSAAEAVEVICELLRQYGQGGNCGHLTPNYYNNSFMITDPTEAYVLETVGREWVLERVDGVRAISNRYSISREALRLSDGLPSLLRTLGAGEDREINYAATIEDPHREHIGSAGARRACSASRLKAGEGRLVAGDVMSILREHGTGGQPHPQWREGCLTERTVCMHAGAEDRPGQTAGSLVSELRRDGAVHWVTGTAAPCISIFKPVLLDVPLPPHGMWPSDRFDARSLWWKHERLHRTAILGDYAAFLESIRSERDALEASFRERIAAAVKAGSPDERAQVVASCWSEAIAMEDRWLARLPSPLPRERTAHLEAWRRMNAHAGLNLERADESAPRMLPALG